MMLADTSYETGLAESRMRVCAAYHMGEAETLAPLIEAADLPRSATERIAGRARDLVEAVRANGASRKGVETFLQEFHLSTPEGVVLMCLAEALLRIPDADTADRLIRDKIGGASWDEHLGQSDSLFVNASTWALMLTGRLISQRDAVPGNFPNLMRGLVARAGEPVIRTALTQAMRMMGRQFVMGRTIEEAMKRAADSEAQGYRYSYDMLGEAALTAADAARYLESYAAAIAALGTSATGSDILARPGISLKLSALHPRFEYAQAGRVVKELPARVLALARRARESGIGLTIDAEEANRLDLTLDVFEMVSGEPDVIGWPGFGIVVQAYQKRAYPMIEWLEALARSRGQRYPVRLVKGAYWDSEIKWAQEGGFSHYPVFTRKAATDVSYLACARRLLASPESFYPQFATHNAHSFAAILEMAGSNRDFEFQRLHGMGEALYGQVVGDKKGGVACRVYAPVGSHEDLLPYLVRRLLENGANTSFVHHVVDPAVPVGDLIADPVARTRRLAGRPNMRIPPPPELYGPDRRNARGLDLSDPLDLAFVTQGLADTAERKWTAGPIVGGEQLSGETRAIHEPADTRRVAGHVDKATAAHVKKSLDLAARAAPEWDAVPAAERAQALERLADLLEENMTHLMALCVREAGKTLPDAVSEVREAVDYCRYYASRARADFAEPLVLPGPTGESNQLTLHGRGVFACISPWNFPLAIFLGQVTAALAAGNAVVAKPADATPLIAAETVRLAHRAGIPANALHLLPGPGLIVGAALTEDPRTAGVVFTGSNETARSINQRLAARPGPILPFIAETGGQNAMIVDSSALPEQVVPDVITSAFRSAGQRCSALRVLFVQEDVAGKVLDMLLGAMDELVIGDPALPETDVGPVINVLARDGLESHVARMTAEATVRRALDLPAACNAGSFFAPHVIEIDNLSRLTGEVFGPVLHVISYQANALDSVIEQINACGFGLTLGIHSRIDETARYVHARTRIGNTYVNRNMIGAVVGVQPFGGQGLSGTGPKAGGPRYLHRFATEKTLTVNTAAAGGNAALLAQEDEPEA